jgi:hypothetical protein
MTTGTIAMTGRNQNDRYPRGKKSIQNTWIVIILLLIQMIIVDALDGEALWNIFLLSDLAEVKTNRSTYTEREIRGFESYFYALSVVSTANLYHLNAF